MHEIRRGPIFREENFVQTNGAGILEVRGGGLEIALFLNGKPLVFDAADCAGSIGRFTTFLDENSLEYNAQIAESAAQGFGNPAPLHEQIAPLLRLLPNGNYRLTLETLHPNSYFYCWEDSVDLGMTNNTLGYYPYDDIYNLTPVLFTTQPHTLLKAEIVNFYGAKIEVGERPALISISAKNHVARFVLDGHHKLFAYQALGIAPHFLHIECEKMATLELHEARTISANFVWPDTKSYLKAKKAESLSFRGLIARIGQLR